MNMTTSIDEQIHFLCISFFQKLHVNKTYMYTQIILATAVRKCNQQYRQYSYCLFLIILPSIKRKYQIDKE